MFVDDARWLDDCIKRVSDSTCSDVPQARVPCAPTLVNRTGPRSLSRIIVTHDKGARYRTLMATISCRRASMSTASAASREPFSIA